MNIMGSGSPAKGSASSRKNRLKVATKKTEKRKLFVGVKRKLCLCCERLLYLSLHSVTYAVSEDRVTR